MSCIHIGITIMSTIVGFGYGNIKLYKLREKYKLRKLNANDIISKVAVPTCVGALVGLFYPIGIPTIGIYQYCKWKEKQEKKNHTVRQ